MDLGSVFVMIVRGDSARGQQKSLSRAQTVFSEQNLLETLFSTFDYTALDVDQNLLNTAPATIVTRGPVLL